MRLNQSRGPKAAEEYFTELPIAATNLFGTSRLRADPPYRLAQEVGGAPSRVGPALARQAISMSPVPSAMASSSRLTRSG